MFSNTIPERRVETARFLPRCLALGGFKGKLGPDYWLSHLLLDLMADDIHLGIFFMQKVGSIPV